MCMFSVLKNYNVWSHLGQWFLNFEIGINCKNIFCFVDVYICACLYKIETKIL
jgi:hypothetical protein